jgi:EmrB/QacA subfamily drug resistance transporter
MTQDAVRYGIRLAIIFVGVWFVDLLDASTLNVALSPIALSLGVDPTDAEWAIIGFLLAMTIGMSISSWCGDRFSFRTVFLLAQICYIASSLGCGFSQTIHQLIFFRLIQGCAGGMTIPLAMATLLRTMPPAHWAKTSSNMNMITLLAPALGPLLAGYVTNFMGWRWLFFIKIPLSLLSLTLSFMWMRKTSDRNKARFDWWGFLCSSASLTLLLWVFSELGKQRVNNLMLSGLFLLALLFAILFIMIEKRVAHPLIPLKIFKISLFTFGNIIQSSANVIFLGANFIIALYLQNGLGKDITTTGWIMSAITPGMVLMVPIIGKFYNRLGPLPFIIPGLILLGSSMCAFMFVTPQTPPLLLAVLIFIEGAASVMVQTPNVMTIFSELPHALKSSGSTLYSLFKQISASFGVALSAMILSVGMQIKGIAITDRHLIEVLPLYRTVFLVLGILPFLALICCRYIDNKKALQRVAASDHLKTEPEFGAE